MDSWVYPALDRLSTLGLIPSQSVTIRPWTRQECRRQLREAESTLYGFRSLDVSVDDATKTAAERLLPDLEHELMEPDGRATAVLDEVYARVGTIAGPTLTDGFHFGQTWWNDYGRPLGRGTSSIAGYRFRAQSGRFFMASRQEFQSDPGLPAVTQMRADLFNQLDNLPFMVPGTPIPSGALIVPVPARSAYVRTRPLELYAGVAFAGNSLTFGKEEIYWGPTTMGPWSFSMNAEPTYNLRFQATRPHPFPFVPSFGSYRFDFVFGKLSGHQHPARPYYNGVKVELSFAQTLELGFTRWSILFGQGHPMTLHNLRQNLFSNTSTGTGQYGDPADPGDRKSGFDFRLHVPGLRNFLTVYADAYADDEVNPLEGPRRVDWQPGFYLARLPGLPHADLRFEVASSEELSRDEGGTRSFINNQYRDGNTNKGFLLGNAVGRDGRAMEARLGYWFSARTHVEAGFRQNKLSEVFLPNGGTITDGFVEANYARGEWTVGVFAQGERFLIPSYLPGAQSNASSRLQIKWTPHRSKELMPEMETNGPLLSIVTVVFRDRDELHEILKNLRPFACSDLEVVVVDGGSQDGTVELLQAFEPPPAFWVSEPDTGIYDAMNKGVAAARGVYVLHLNAGDRLLAIPWEALRASSREEIDVICGRVLLDEGVTFVSRTSLLSKIDNTWHHQGTFYRRAAHLGYDTRYRTHGDFDHNQRLMLKGASMRQDSTVVARHDGQGVTIEGSSHAETLHVVRRHFGLFWWSLAHLRFTARNVRRRWRMRQRSAQR